MYRSTRLQNTIALCVCASPTHFAARAHVKRMCVTLKSRGRPGRKRHVR